MKNTSHRTRIRFDTGQLCLDFVGTVAPLEVSPVEVFTSPEVVKQWFLAARQPAHRVEPSEVDVDRALALRKSFRVILDAVLDGPDPENEALLGTALKIVNDATSFSPPRTQLVPGPDGQVVCQFEGVTTSMPLFAALARDFVSLLADPQARERLGRCAAPDCGRVFWSLPGVRPRRWCSSQGCGARTRVAVHRSRAVASGTEVEERSRTTT